MVYIFLLDLIVLLILYLFVIGKISRIRRELIELNGYMNSYIQSGGLKKSKKGFHGTDSDLISNSTKTISKDGKNIRSLGTRVSKSKDKRT